MEDLKKKLEVLNKRLKLLEVKLNFEDLRKELVNLNKLKEGESFWKNNNSAQDVINQILSIEKKINPLISLEKDLKDILELVEIKDNSLREEIEQDLQKIDKKIMELENKKFLGEYDDHNTILTIFSGAGGTDAQDWTEMLSRMYLKWAEKKGFKVKVIDQTPGDEAGLKNIIIEIDGENSYGLLKKEHGVHRLVRLSPFNSANLRQTSFARVDVIPKINQSNEVNINENDLKVDVFRSGGHGGQSVNTTDSAVRITHLPTKVSVVIQNERSQLQNKDMAITILKSRLLQLLIEQNAKAIEDIRGNIQSAEWGNQIRSYVLHPYKQVKDLRSNFISNNPNDILDGNIDNLLESNL